MLRLLCCLLLLAAADLQAYEMGSIEREDSSVIQLRNRREKAAQFRIELAQFVPPAGYHEAAAEQLRLAKLAQQNDQVDEAYDLAWDAYRDYPFSDSGDQLLECFIIAATERGRISYASRALIDLWYRYPRFDRLDELLTMTMDKAEELQNPQGAIDWSAEEPRDVINRDAVEGLLEADMFFRFLAQHGDYHDIAPRATLGLARSILIGGYTSRDRIMEARIAYMDLLQRYPESELVFSALCEYALCQLLGFRGDRYDGGVLERAALIIDQAELYTDNRPERNELIARYRALITRWHQLKDYRVARWYDRKGHKPSALYYYKAAVAYDSASETARKAQRAIARIEPEVQEEAVEQAAEAETTVDANSR